MSLHAIVTRYGGVEMMGPNGPLKINAIRIVSSVSKLGRKNENLKLQRADDWSWEREEKE
jgi:hypothetical protein